MKEEGVDANIRLLKRLKSNIEKIIGIRIYSTIVVQIVYYTLKNTVTEWLHLYRQRIVKK